MSKAAVSKAARYAAQFEVRTRTSGERFTCLRDDAADEDALTDLVRDVHDGGSTPPCDWLYEEVRAAFETLDGYSDAEAAADEAEADYATRDLLAWLTDFPDAVDLVDECLSETAGSCGLVAAISTAQARKRGDIIRAVSAWMDERDE